MIRKLILIRHGESEANIDNDLYFKMKDHEITLTKRGELQPLECVNAIRGYDLDYKIYHSPFKRAIDTANIISKNLSGGYILQEHPLLHERSWGGSYNEAAWEKYEFDIVNDFFFRPPHGESYSDTYARMHAFMMEMKTQTWEGHRIVVTHGEWIRLALKMHWNQSVVDFMDKPVSPKNCVPYFIDI